MSDLISSKACCSFASQVNAASFFRSVLSGSDLVDRSSKNLDRYVTTPSSLLTSSLLVGAGMACMLSLFLWVWLDSFFGQSYPHNSVFLSWNLSMVLPSPQMRLSSAMALVPSSPSKLSSILF